MKAGIFFDNTVQIRMICADIPYAFRRFMADNIAIYEVVSESDLSVVFSVNHRDISKVIKIMHILGADFEVLHQWGIGWVLYQLRCRSLLIACLIVFVIFTVWIPSRIFFIRVQGNQRVSEQSIIQCAESIGLKFGCKRSEIRSETMKNYLIETIPEIDWIGITSSGCVATIEVRENTENSKDTESNAGSMVALCDGIVKSVTVMKGNALCKPGQVVQKGEVLISGYEDCGLIIKHNGAKGEIIADTFRFVQMKTPRNLLKKQKCIEVKRMISIRMGKKFINFVKDSGISPAGCDKMYSEKYLTLPGGFELPIGVIQERYSYCETDHVSLPEDSYSWLTDSAKYYLNTQMMAGEILRENNRTDCIDHTIIFRGEYFCTEQIGKYKFEEIPDYGKDS